MSSKHHNGYELVEMRKTSLYAFWDTFIILGFRKMLKPPSGLPLEQAAARFNSQA